MNIHFIAIGGAVMHNLAIALKQAGNNITGSDDEIFDPALSKLKKYDLLPSKIGWNAGNINKNIDAVILGMHAVKDNPELARAKELNIPIYSFPEFIYEHSRSKKRVVIGGSHGKTTTTAMIMHVLKQADRDFDYMVGAQLEGFELTVRLSNTADVIILEGDEYPDSAINKVPKFHLYKADIGVITGIAWDHINIFPTFDLYKEQFKIFAEQIPQNGVLIYCAEDKVLDELVKASNIKARVVPYSAPEYKIENGYAVLPTVPPKSSPPVGGRTLALSFTERDTPLGARGRADIKLEIFGRHNMQNMMAAKYVCNELGIDDDAFFKSISSFKGAAKRLELVAKNDS
jgi:UDP-N-acetylmuramate: L-alanyl-gamma-D-glutamyl-meso-diaminopimelate ligase